MFFWYLRSFKHWRISIICLCFISASFNLCWKNVGNSQNNCYSLGTGCSGFYFCVVFFFLVVIWGVAARMLRRPLLPESVQELLLSQVGIHPNFSSFLFFFLHKKAHIGGLPAWRHEREWLSSLAFFKFSSRLLFCPGPCWQN